MVKRNKAAGAEHEAEAVRLPGAIVRVKRGRDRYRTFAVIGLDPDNATAPLIISDGRLHPAKQRKHKNPAHLELLGMPVETDRKKLSEGAEDVEIAEICLKYEKLFGNEKNPLDKQVPDIL